MNKIPQHILNLLERCTVTGNELAITCGQLERATYLALNKVLEALGGKWNRKTKTHVFPEDPVNRIEEAILTGSYTDGKKDLGFFETPAGLAERVIGFADIQHGHRVLEPSAGTGNLLAAIGHTRKDCKAVAVEINSRLAKNLKTQFMVNVDVCCCDFLQCNGDLGRFDRVVMNPPFSVPGQPQADIDHVTHAFEFLKPGGRLVAIMSAGVKFRENSKTKQFREMVREIYDNPPDSFKVSGTSVNTVTVILEKPA